MADGHADDLVADHGRARGRQTSAPVGTLPAMDALRLFAPEEPMRSRVRRRPLVADPDERAVHRVELFLADHLEPEGDLALIQATLGLCEATGEDIAALDALVIDHTRFPRSRAAVERTRELLAMPVEKRPEGFWPRFLLEQLESSAS